MTHPVKETTPVPPSTSGRAHNRRLRHILIWLSYVLVLIIVAAAIAGDVLLHHAAPILKAKVIETLSTRFDSRVQLDKFDVSLVKGFQVSGSGLKLYPNHLQIDAPLIAVNRFSFRVLGWRQLLHTPLRVHHVQVSGLSIHMPPKDQRGNMPHLSDNQKPGEDQSHAGIKIEVVQIDVDHADLVIENGKPNKVPLDFVINKLTLQSVAAGQPMKFHATLVNPRPIGNIDSSGDFGPFNTQSPGDTNVRGTYSFRNADLNSIKGLGGILEIGRASCRRV